MERNVAMSGKTHKIADVKCYFCGHISGQLEGMLGDGVDERVFKPRPGFGGTAPLSGRRLRCERCGGPVYLEDVTPMTIDNTVLARRPSRVPAPVSRARKAA